MYTFSIQKGRKWLPAGAVIVGERGKSPGLRSDGGPVRAGVAAAQKRQLRVSMQPGGRFYL